jgi:20S proteasome subunit alpha 3
MIGRLHQVQYAMEAITQAGTCVGVLTPEGIVLGAQKRVVSKLLETKGQTYDLFGHIIVQPMFICANLPF